MDDFTAQAREWGIEPGHLDVFGKWHAASAATLRALLEALKRTTGQPDAPKVRADALRVFQGNTPPTWALTVQLYAVRSAANWGIGDFGDLAAIVRVAAKSGAGAVGVNPLHALFLDRPSEASPYSPNSRLFLNPLYVDVDAVEDYERASEDTVVIETLRAGNLVDYPAVAALKLKALRRAYDRFMEKASAVRRDDFGRFRAEQGSTLRRYACFEVLSALYTPKRWRDWPAPWSSPDAAVLDDFHRAHTIECGFYEYLQWIADCQIGQCRDIAKASGLPIGLYLDLAVGVHPDGADAWSDQDAILRDVSIGAPPDEFNPAGQNWGLAPFNPNALPQNDFAAVRQLMRAAMRHAGAVRLDHVLGLMRLFLIPKGEGGTYVRYPFEAQLRVIAEESHRYRCLFIGEDLGTVPEGFRDITARWGVWRYLVMVFERWENGLFKAPDRYPADALATFDTHDLPTYRGWMTSHDLDMRRSLGIGTGETLEQREQSRESLRGALAHYAPNYAPGDFAGVAAYLGQSPARLVALQIEDLIDVADQANIPGTVDEHPNWRRKLPVPLEEWAAQPTFRRTMLALEKTGRCIPRSRSS